jgi:hypothetical protein
MQLDPKEFELLIACTRICTMQYRDTARAAYKLGKYQEGVNAENFAYWCDVVRAKLEMEHKRLGLMLPITIAND